MNEGFAMRGRGSQNDEAETPGWLYAALDHEFGFTYDAAASALNYKYAAWTDDILSVADAELGRVFCNPPYSNILPFVKTALLGNCLWVFLLPAFVDKDWHRLLWESPRVTWRPFRKRIVFEYQGKPIVSKSGKPQGPFFGSTVAIVRPR